MSREFYRQPGTPGLPTLMMAPDGRASFRGQRRTDHGAAETERFGQPRVKVIYALAEGTVNRAARGRGSDVETQLAQSRAQQEAFMHTFFEYPNTTDKTPQWKGKNQVKTDWDRVSGTGTLHVNGYDVALQMVHSVDELKAATEAAGLKPQDAMVVIPTNAVSQVRMAPARMEHTPYAALHDEDGYNMVMLGGIKKPEDILKHTMSGMWGNLVRATVYFEDQAIYGAAERPWTKEARVESPVTKLFDGGMRAVFPNAVSELVRRSENGTQLLDPVLMGCAHYNEAGTGITDRLLPNFAGPAAERVARAILENPELMKRELTIVAVGRDILGFDLARQLLPPAMVEGLVHGGLTGQAYQAELERVGQELDRSMELSRQFAEAITRLGVPTRIITYPEYLGAATMHRGEQFAQEPAQRAVAEQIGAERAKVYEFYRSVGAEAAAQRATANSSLYYALAERLMMPDAQRTVMIDVENDPDYWRRLGAGVREVAGTYPPIVMPEEPYCLPYGAQRGRVAPRYTTTAAQRALEGVFN